MNTISKGRVAGIVAGLGFFLLAQTLPLFSEAATIKTIATERSAGGAFEIEVRVITDEHSVNAVEGVLQIPDGVTDIQVSTAGSAFPVFAAGPVYEIGDRSISFTAGAPGGIKEGSEGLVFSVYGKAQSVGSYTFEMSSARAYRNDGEGTAENVSKTPTSIQVERIDTPPKNLALENIQSDTIKPNITVEIGRDNSLFEGNYFLAFYGSDVGSGISYFEVSEGWRDFGTIKDFYILKDQKLGSVVRVRAYDEAGNATISYVWPEHPLAHAPYYGALVLIGVALFSMFLWLRKRHDLRNAEARV